MSTIRATTLSNLAGSQTISTDRVAQGTAAAWVNFNGTGTVAIRASYNVSSITDNGTGDYTVNFTTAMPDANYCVTASRTYTIYGVPTTGDPAIAVGIKTASSQRLHTGTGTATSNSTFAPNDPTEVNVAIFR